MQSPGLIDYHIHTAVTIDGKMDEIQACERAVAIGLQEIAFTNHVMLNQPDYLVSPEAFVAHWKQIQICQQRYPQLKIRLGIEMDYYHGREQEIAASLRRYEDLIGRPFDLVLGAIHELHGVFFSNKDQAPNLYKDRDLLSLYRDYFILSIEAVRSCLFDVIAHPDLIKKYTHELTPPIAFKRYRPAVEPFIEALLDVEVGMDVNTKGMKAKVGEPYPSVELLDLYLSKSRDRGMEPILTLGSDAHEAREVGGNIPDCAKLLFGMGQRTIMSFEKRRRSPIGI